MINAKLMADFISHNIRNKNWLYWPPGPMVGQVFDLEQCKKDCETFLSKHILNEKKDAP